MSTDQASASKPLSAVARLDRNTPIAGFFADPANAHGVATNINAEGREGLRLVMKATSQADFNSDTIKQDSFAVKYYYAHLVTMLSQTGGELIDRVRLVLISPDGKTLSFVSEGAIDSLDVIRRYEGDGPYVTPLNVVVVPQKTRRGSTVLRLELAEDVPSPKESVHHRGSAK